MLSATEKLQSSAKKRGAAAEIYRTCKCELAISDNSVIAPSSRRSSNDDMTGAGNTESSTARAHLGNQNCGTSPTAGKISLCTDLLGCG